jgi:hypothetical protein
VTAAARPCSLAWDRLMSRARLPQQGIRECDAGARRGAGKEQRIALP